MNVAHLLNPYPMIKSIFLTGSPKEFTYEMNDKSKGIELRRFNELISTLDQIAQDDEIDMKDDWLYVSFDPDGHIQITTNFGKAPDDDDYDEEEDEYDDEDYGNLYFHFDHLANFKSMEKESA